MKEVQKVLEELKGVRPEKLTGEAKRLFEAIMKIADERDELEYKYNRAIEDLIKLEKERQADKEKINNVLGLIFQYGQIDGEHHKTWVIDQIVRILTENDYDKWVQHYEYDEETGEDYTWDTGIAP